MKRVFGQRVSRMAMGAGVMVATLAMSATVVQAHVSINTLGEVEQGSFSKIGFSVPNERDDSGTVSVKVQMPPDSPMPFISVQPKAGWEITTEKRTLDTPLEMFGSSYDEVVDTITWTATGDTQIGPGQFELFWISAGALPTDVTTLAFPAIQTYASGEVVEWIDPMVEGAEEPEHPAPTLTLVAPGGGDTEAVVGATDSDTGSDDSSNTLSIIALVVGALGLVVGGTALATSRKRTAA